MWHLKGKLLAAQGVPAVRSDLPIARLFEGIKSGDAERVLLHVRKDPSLLETVGSKNRTAIQYATAHHQSSIAIVLLAEAAADSQIKERAARAALEAALDHGDEQVGSEPPRVSRRLVGTSDQPTRAEGPWS
jgi:hypothetical protein